MNTNDWVSVDESMPQGTDAVPPLPEWIDSSYTLDKRTITAYVREAKGKNLRNVFIRLVETADIVGGVDAIDTYDVDASVDVDGEGNLIGITIYWKL